jgi:hypothetical protein
MAQSLQAGDLTVQSAAAALQFLLTNPYLRWKKVEKTKPCNMIFTTLSAFGTNRK